MSNSVLKPGWQWVKFGDVVKLSGERRANPAADGLERYVGLEHLEPNDLRIRRWGDTRDGTTFTNYFKPRQVLFGKRRAYQRKVAVADFEGVCSGDIYVFEPKDKRLLPELLPFICQTEAFFDYAIGTSAGSLSPRTNWKSLAQYEFTLPPLEAQENLLNSLKSIDTCIENYESMQLAARNTAQSLANSVFDMGSLRSHSKESSQTKGSNSVPLSTLCSLQSGYPFPSKEYTQVGDRLLRCSNVGVNSTNWLDKDTRFWDSSRRDEFQDYILTEKDIVIAMDRPFVSEGFKVARIRVGDLPALLLQRVGRLLLNDNADSDFVWCFLNSPSFKSQLVSRQQGTDLPHISKFDIEETKIPQLPAATRKMIGKEFRSLECAAIRARQRIDGLIEFRKSALSVWLTS